MKAFIRELRIAFSPILILVILCFSVMLAAGHATALLPMDTIGNQLINEFGGCIWSEEIDIHEILNWFIIFIPSGLAVSAFLHHKLYGILSMQGYRYRHTIRWYMSLMVQCIAIVFLIAAIQFLFSILIAYLGGHRSFSIWIQDADGFVISNESVALVAPILFVMYNTFIVFCAVIAYLVFRRMTSYYLVLIVPSLLSALFLSRPSKDNLYHLISCGMACRLSVEGSFGVPVGRAVITLLLAFSLVCLLGGFYSCFVKPFDKKFD